MIETAFDDAMIASWDAALDDKPSEVTELQLGFVPQVEAFSLAILNVGLAIRFRARDRSEYGFFINPVAARRLAAVIINAGQQAGWLSEGADVIKPPFPEDDR